MSDGQKNINSQSDYKESLDILLIEELAKLIKQDKEKGKTAWKIGHKLSVLKKQIVEEFEIFIAENLGLSKRQAERRIEIYEWISDPKLITKDMCISHLEQVVRLKDKIAIEKMLKDLSLIESKNKANRLSYTENIIASVVKQYTQHRNRNNFQESIETTFSFIENLENEIAERKNQHEQAQKKSQLVWGPDLESVHLPEIRSFYSKQPIDEQGLVGLFCTIFPIIKKKFLPIEFLCFLGLSRKHKMKFSKIKGIRQRFPDAEIEVDIFNENSDVVVKTTALKIEFEFDSSNYIDHKHYNDKEFCDLIISWKHDQSSQIKWEKWKSLNYDKRKLLPFIFSVEKFLESGEINLTNLNEP